MSSHRYIAHPSTGLFGSITDRLKQKMQMTLQGVNNVYTRHKPVFVDVIDQARKGKLKVRFCGATTRRTDGRTDGNQPMYLCQTHNLSLHYFRRRPFPA